MMDETSWEKFRRAVQDEPFDAEAWEEEGRRRRVEVLVAARKEVLMALDASCRDDMAAFRTHLLKAVAATAPAPMSDVERYYVEAGSTGYQGGDAGHGGHAYVKFHGAEGCHSGKLDAEDEGKPYSLDRSGWADVGSTFVVTLEAHGDWEQSGLYVAILEAAVTLSETLEAGTIKRVEG